MPPNMTPKAVPSSGPRCSNSTPNSWEWVGEGLPELPAWATAQDELTWAPAVLERNGRYVMYYTARATDMHVQSISVAVADSPVGPFVDNSMRPLICPTALGGAIDPSPFIDVDGKAYLLWKNDGNSRKLRTSLWIQELSDDGLSLVGEPMELIHEDQPWEYPLIEGPSMVCHEGRYYLFYSANDYQGENYAGKFEFWDRGKEMTFTMPGGKPMTCAPEETG